MPPKPLPLPAASSGDPGQDEERLVHTVYEQIAPHFARTRFKPWPLIQEFLGSLPAGSIGLDSGAGNGKYLPSVAAAGAWAVALDRSRGLLDIARGQPGVPGGPECVRGDLCDRAWRRGVFDFAISVAAIHHLSTPERRRSAVQALLHPLRLSDTAPYGRFFIYVWAYEQGPASRRKMGSATDAASGGHDAVQDVLVPWVLAPQKIKTTSSKSTAAAAATPIATAVTGTARPAKAAATGKEERVEEEEKEAEVKEPKVFHRYYHLFVQGELQDLVESAAAEDGFVVLKDRGDSAGNNSNSGEKWLRVAAVGWEADNWWIEGEVGQW